MNDNTPHARLRILVDAMRASRERSSCRVPGDDSKGHRTAEVSVMHCAETFCSNAELNALYVRLRF
jgi:hypothetical protein